jgi:hypothetical protein
VSCLREDNDEWKPLSILSDISPQTNLSLLETILTSFSNAVQVKDHGVRFARVVVDRDIHLIAIVIEGSIKLFAF